MARFDIVIGTGIGPIHFGMDAEQLGRLIAERGWPYEVGLPGLPLRYGRRIEDLPEPTEGVEEELRRLDTGTRLGFETYLKTASTHESSVMIGQQNLSIGLRSRRVTNIVALGVGCDSQCMGVEPDHDFVLDGVDVFRTPAEELVAMLAERSWYITDATDASTSPPGLPEHSGFQYDFIDLGVSLWRSTPPEDMLEGIEQGWAEPTPEFDVRRFRYFECLMLYPPGTPSLIAPESRRVIGRT